jgi:hypothetical protein
LLECRVLPELACLVRDSTGRPPRTLSRLMASERASPSRRFKPVGWVCAFSHLEPAPQVLDLKQIAENRCSFGLRSDKMAYVAVANIIRRREPNGHRPKYARENESKSNEHAASSPKQSTPITLHRAASGISNRRPTNVHALSARITGRYRGCRRRFASAATHASEVKQFCSICSQRLLREFEILAHPK